MEKELVEVYKPGTLNNVATFTGINCLFPSEKYKQRKLHLVYDIINIHT